MHVFHRVEASRFVLLDAAIFLITIMANKLPIECNIRISIQSTDFHEIAITIEQINVRLHKISILLLKIITSNSIKYQIPDWQYII